MAQLLLNRYSLPCEKSVVNEAVEPNETCRHVRVLTTESTGLGPTPAAMLTVV